jgi:hypothetical protein
VSEIVKSSVEAGRTLKRDLQVPKWTPAAFGSAKTIEGRDVYGRYSIAGHEEVGVQCPKSSQKTIIALECKLTSFASRSFLPFK